MEHIPLISVTVPCLLGEPCAGSDANYSIQCQYKMLIQAKA